MTNQTTIWVDSKTRDNLRLISELKERSMAGQLRYWVTRELESLKESGLLKDQDVEDEDNGSSL